MNPITNVAATCTRLSPNISPRSSPWHSPVMAYKFGKTLAVPANEPHRSGHGGRRGSHDKRELFAYPDKPVKKDEARKRKKNIRFEINKHEKDKPGGSHAANTTTTHDHGAEQKKKKLKDVAKEVKIKESKSTSSKTKKNKKNKGCILM